MKTYFKDLTTKILGGRQAGEHFLFSMAGENSQFIRVNAAKVRQTGVVEDAVLEVTLLLEGQNKALRKATRAVTLSGLMWQDWEEVSKVLSILRKEVPGLPLDPFAELPVDHGSHVAETQGYLLDPEAVPEKLLGGATQGLDLAGIYAAGPIFRGMANSAGQFLWFSTETFSFDFSIYTASQRALKETYAGSRWDHQEYETRLAQARDRLPVLEMPAKRVPRGTYRTYLAPDAVADILTMFSWGAVSEASIQQGDSPLRLVRQGQKTFSPHFTLAEDFSSGRVPRFNNFGEIAEDRLVLIEKGQLKNTLVSSRTALEYRVRSNAAAPGEAMRTPAVSPGTLKAHDILKRIGTGLYLSNLHYLNWSDQTGGRITGMTRYACFWVDGGKIVAPIENMRWDDSIFSLLGNRLEDLTEEQTYVADVMSYERRALGGAVVPGALISGMDFTL